MRPRGPLSRADGAELIVVGSVAQDVGEETLLVGYGTKIKFNKDGIARIFGIPCCGRKVGEHGKPGRGVVSKIMTEYLNMNPKEFRSIKAIQEVVDREYEVEMTKHKKDPCKVAFVMYVMSTMLVPGGRFDYVSIDYWDGLENVDDTCLYDWLDFVMRRLLDAVVKMKTDINSRKKIQNITGCTLFLQVLYLDSVDLGVWTMEHSSFPRIRCFGPDRLKSMIRADIVKQTLDPKDREFGKSKLLPVMRVCYSWAAESEGIVIGENCSSNKLALWRATILFARLIGLPTEVSASLFQVFVGFDDNMASSMVSNLISVVEPYSSGIKNRCVGDQYKMNGGPGDNVVCDAEDVNSRGEEYGSCLDDCKGKRKCYADSSSTDSDEAICFNVKKVMSGYEVDSGSMCSGAELVMNSVQGGGSLVPMRSSRKEVVQMSGLVLTPVEVGFKLEYTVSEASHHISGLLNGGPQGGESGPCLLHYNPKYIEVFQNLYRGRFLDNVNWKWTCLMRLLDAINYVMMNCMAATVMCGGGILWSLILRKDLARVLVNRYSRLPEKGTPLPRQEITVLDKSGYAVTHNSMVAQVRKRRTS